MRATAALIAAALIAASCGGRVDSPAASSSTARPSAPTASAAATPRTGITPGGGGPLPADPSSSEPVRSGTPAVRTPLPRQSEGTGLHRAAGSALLEAFAQTRASRGTAGCLADAGGQAAVEARVSSALAGISDGTAIPTVDLRADPELAGITGSVVVVPRSVTRHPWGNIDVLVRTNRDALFASGPRYCYAVVHDLPGERAYAGVWVR